MEKVIMKAARTDNGYCCACDLIPGWVVAYDGDINGFKDYVKESIEFYVEGRKRMESPTTPSSMANIVSYMTSIFLPYLIIIVAFFLLPHYKLSQE